MCLISTCSPPYNTRHFRDSLASDSIGTSNSGKSIPKMGDPLGSSHVSSQKQNRESLTGAKSGQYRAMAESGLDGLTDINIMELY
ncbi:hypothetical protein DVH24_025273 [Malus domestica]|uniref:Uncharacterized protein n=1 Tax=Malus domestica TaxID=3750 RepID=A0A498HPE3_MALDO|nr:hypothetical protein DVH24_025273 [Malus domestica]